MERLRELVENGYGGGTMYSGYLMASRRLARFIASPEGVEVLATVLCLEAGNMGHWVAKNTPAYRTQATAILQFLAQKALDDGS